MREAEQMSQYIKQLEIELAQITNGFKVEEQKAKIDFEANDSSRAKELAFSAYRSDVYQLRMYGVFLFGHLADDKDILNFMLQNVSKDENWRVQEVLAKAFDEYCRRNGFEKSLPVIDLWLQDKNPNARRAVTEGLRIWTSRPYFKDNPEEAIRRLADLRNDSSEYVRKSVGNALRDISKKHGALVAAELATWDLSSKEVLQVFKLASRLIEK